MYYALPVGTIGTTLSVAVRSWLEGNISFPLAHAMGIEYGTVAIGPVQQHILDTEDRRTSYFIWDWRWMSYSFFGRPAACSCTPGTIAPRDPGHLRVLSPGSRSLVVYLLTPGSRAIVRLIFAHSVAN